MPTIPEGTKFIGIAPEVSVVQKRSTQINDQSAGYTAQQIAADSGQQTYWFVSPTPFMSVSYVQHDDFIDKSLYQFEVISAGTDMVTGEMVDYDPLIGRFTFEADLSEQPVRVNLWINYEVIL